MGKLGFTARSVVEGFLSGVHRSPFKGFSLEFAEHRQYYPGDEIRKIDWRAFGKTDRYYIREYEDETNLKAVFVVDASGSMAYRGAGQLTKFAYAQQVAASLAYLLLGQLDAVGLLTHDTAPRCYLPPKATRKQLFLLLQELERTTPGRETNLGAIWDRIAGQYLKRRGLVILISDALDELPSLGRSLRHLRHARHDVLLLQILTPEEVEFPFNHPTKFESLETSGANLTVDARRYREEYLRMFAEHQRGLRKLASELRFDHVVLRTDQPVGRALGAYLAHRKQRR